MLDLFRSESSHYTYLSSSYCVTGGSSLRYWTVGSSLFTEGSHCYTVICVIVHTVLVTYVFMLFSVNVFICAYAELCNIYSAISFFIMLCFMITQCYVIMLCFVTMLCFADLGPEGPPEL